jgi:Gp157 protein
VDDNLPVVLIPSYEPPRSWRTRLAVLHQHDDDLADPNLDVVKLVDELRDDVDGLHMVERRMEVTAEWLRAYAQPLIDKAKAVENNRERTRDYIVESMEAQNVTKFPGKMFKVELQPASQPSLIIRDAQPGDVAAWPNLAKCERKYVWDTKAVKSALAAGLLPDTFPGRLVRSNWPRFTPNIPESLERKRKTRSKKVELTKTEPKAIAAGAGSGAPSADSPADPKLVDQGDCQGAAKTLQP